MWYRIMVIGLWCLGVGYGQAETAGPLRPTPTQSESAGNPGGLNRVNPAPSIPPELMRQILEMSSKPENRVMVSPLSRAHRVLVGMMGLLIVLSGGYVCRLARDGGAAMRAPMCRMLLFSLFSGLSAMCLACAFAGTLYLHVAAAVCTAGGGFSVAMLLVPQFGLSRRWIMEPEEREGDKS